MPGLISVKTRWLIVFLYRHWLGPHKPKSYVCKKLNVSEDTVDHWVDVYERTGDVVSETSTSLKKTSGWKENHIISSLVYANPEATLNQIVEAAGALGYSLSSTTVWRRLQSMSIKYGAPISKPLLSAEQRMARLRFARMNKSRDWSSVLFTDEASIQIFTPPRKVWKLSGSKVISRVVKHPLKLHMWACFSMYGFGRIVIFSGTLNAKRMVKIYQNGLLSSAKDLFDDDWTLQEDNDPKHMSKLAKKWKKDNSIDRMTWPSNSPDLNPMENVWRILKNKVRKRHPQTKSQLEEAIKEEWNQLPKNLAWNLANSMPTRLNQVLQRKGDSIDY